MIEVDTQRPFQSREQAFLIHKLLSYFCRVFEKGYQLCELRVVAQHSFVGLCFLRQQVLSREALKCELWLDSWELSDAESLK